MPGRVGGLDRLGIWSLGANPRSGRAAGGPTRPGSRSLHPGCRPECYWEAYLSEVTKMALSPVWSGQGEDTSGHFAHHRDGYEWYKGT
jgi:hypothetical protein